MQQYSKEEAIGRMNRLAAAGKPFIFIISYGQEHAYIEEVDQVDASLCLFNFNGRTNADMLQLPLTHDVEWNFEPMSQECYGRAFRIVKNNILAGNSYLANLTCRVPISTNFTLKEMFFHSQALYKLWMKDSFVCFSPEIFVRIEGGKIKSFPMKGTIDATLPNAWQQLMDNAKEAAEHATIVDLIRNDLSMVSDQVTVTRYRYCDWLKTNRGAILQTSSEICGTLPGGYLAHIGDIIFRLLPAGSITGAPKRKTVEIIAEAENYERRFYTGVMGYCDGFRLDSAVMIRFVEQEADGRLYFKAGGGITGRSDLESEYNEMKQKVYVPIY